VDLSLLVRVVIVRPRLCVRCEPPEGAHASCRDSSLFFRPNTPLNRFPFASVCSVTPFTMNPSPRDPRRPLLFSLFSFTLFFVVYFLFFFFFFLFSCDLDQRVSAIKIARCKFLFGALVSPTRHRCFVEYLTVSSLPSA